MSYLTRLDSKWGSGEVATRLSTADVDELSSRLPSDFLEYWREHGLRSFGDGLFRFVDPRLFDEALDEWLGPEHGLSTIMAFAFGDLLLIGPAGTRFLAVHDGELAKMGGRPRMFIDFSLTDDEYVADGLWGNLFAEVNPNLGPLADDECYTFEPALSTGGEAVASNVVKVKLVPQLSILAQLNGPTQLR